MTRAAITGRIRGAEPAGRLLRFRDTDRLLVISTLALVAVGIIMVYSTSYIMAMNRFGDEYFFIKKHLIFVAVGTGLFVAAARTPYTIYRRLALPGLVLATALLLLIFVPGLGVKAGGARRWVRAGLFAFQPSEAAKLAVVVFLARSLSKGADEVKDFYRGFLPNVIVPGIVVALVLIEPDLGTSVMLAVLITIMTFAGGVRLRYFFGLAAASAPFVYIMMARHGYMIRRLSVFLDPWKDVHGAGFQIVQSFIAFGSGGITGVGLGEGMQKLFYLPEAHTDFILSVIGEELGLIGVVFVVALYVVFLYCGVRTALRSTSLFGAYLALGLTTMVVLQAAVNMAVVMGLLPPKGLTLPFVSYGGTSLVVNMMAAGMLLNIYLTDNEAL